MSERWTHALLDELSRQGDEVAGKIVLERLARCPFDDQPGTGILGADQLREQMFAYMGEMKHRGGRTALAQKWYESPAEPPDWMCTELLVEGQRFFAVHGLEMSVALFFASLPTSYAVTQAASVLHRVSDLATNDLVRRVAETGHMLIDVMGMAGDGSFRAGGRAHGTACGLRVLHGFVRELVRAHGWDTSTFGEPANQEMLISTLLDFTVVTWHAIERMGVPVSLQVRRAHLHAWSVVGHLMGVAPALLPLELEDASALSRLLQERHFPADDSAIATAQGQQC